MPADEKFPSCADVLRALLWPLRHVCSIRVAPCAARAIREPRRLQVLFGELAKIVGHGTGNIQRRRAISDRLAAEAIADFIDGAICLGALRIACRYRDPVPNIVELKWRENADVPRELWWTAPMAAHA
jgi:hypothetical protein